MSRSGRHIARGIILLLGAAFIGVALASYNVRDMAESWWRARNLCGFAGKYLAVFLRGGFGPFFAWYWALLLGFLAAVSLAGLSIRSMTRRVLCSLGILWVLVTATAVVSAEGGGLVGVKTHGLLVLIAGSVGSVLILIGAICCIAIILFFERVVSFLRRFKGLHLPRFPWQRREGKEARASARQKKTEKAAAPKIVTAPSASAKRAAAEEPRRYAEEGEPEAAVEEPIRISVPVPPRPAGADLEGAPPAPRPAAHGDMPLPPLSLLESYESRGVTYSTDDLLNRSKTIEQKLKDYGLEGKIQEVRPGPVVTTFEFVPAAGVKVSQIASRADDISLALAAKSIRIEAPIPGRGAVGIEVPNPQPSLVSVKELLEHYPEDKDGLTVALGKTVTGEPFFGNIADMPHLLIAGATGSGKSVCINAIICSLLFHHTPATCQFILVDPKRLELSSYRDIPHLLHPVITDARTTLKVLQWLTVEMDRRYKLLATIGVKNIQGFNRKIAAETVPSPETGEPLERLPYYVTIIDELADIMVMMGNEIYPPITRLSQMARAVGIHLVFATQRPSVDVVTGLIKANFPCRIAFQVASKTDSRTILDANGAEKLLGNGDMLYLPKNLPNPLRLQGAYISETETERVASYWRGFGAKEEPLELDEVVEDIAGDDAEIDDELYNKAKELVILHQQGSISLLQRRLRVGYARAARLIDMMEQAGVVGPFEGSKARRVLVSRESYEQN